MQVTQEIFVVEEWVRDARNEARAEANSRAEAKKPLRALKQEKQELGTKLTVEEKARRNAEARLKNLQDQAEDQRKKLYLIEIELAIQKHLVLHLKADLEKANAAARAAEEAIEASKQASYIRGIEEIEVRQAEELAEVCKNYCKATWVEAFNLAKVPANSKWRQLGSVYYHPEIHEIPTALLSPSALALKSSEQPLTVQATLPHPEASKGPSLVGYFIHQ